MTYKNFSEWGNLDPGNLNANNRRFSNANVTTVKELVFVLYHGGATINAIYEYIHIDTPFGEILDGYYVSATSAGQLKIYYSKSAKIIDVYTLPTTLKQILYR